jgi:predicted metal-dependent hydrolase
VCSSDLRSRQFAASPEHAELPDLGLGAPVEWRRHAGARRMTLRVSRTRGAIVVTAPPQCDQGEVGAFLQRHREWVRERLGSLPQPVPFKAGERVPLRGEMHRLAAAGSGDLRVVSRYSGADGPEIRVRGQAEHFSRRLTDWLMREAARDLDERVQVHCRALGVGMPGTKSPRAPGVGAKRIAVRDQASRWGSCSTTGVLSFSWRLVMAPPMVLDYVAAHEVAHLIEMNHGPRFWALVRKAMARTEEARAWLNRNGLDLHRYGSRG